MDSRATQQCNMCPMFMQFTGCHQPVQGFFGQKMQLIGWENANACVMRNARAHKLQWSGPTVQHSSTVTVRNSALFYIWPQLRVYGAPFLLPAPVFPGAFYRARTMNVTYFCFQLTTFDYTCANIIS